MVERKKGVWFARVFVPGVGDMPAQIGRVFRGTKKLVRDEVAAWEAEIKGRAPSAVNGAVAELLDMWQAMALAINK